MSLSFVSQLSRLRKKGASNEVLAARSLALDAEIGVSTVDYLSYCRGLGDFTTIPRHLKYKQQDYEEYLKETLHYLEDFFLRKNPLVDADKVSFSRLFLSPPLCLLSAVSLCLVSAVSLCLVFVVSLCLLFGVSLCLFFVVSLCLVSAVSLCLLFAVSLCLVFVVSLCLVSAVSLCLLFAVSLCPSLYLLDSLGCLFPSFV